MMGILYFVYKLKNIFEWFSTKGNESRKGLEDTKNTRKAKKTARKF
jgi:hypothetical protein